MKAGRNDACPCGSGKKYKKCCLPGDEAKADVAPSLPDMADAATPAVMSPPPAQGPDLSRLTPGLRAMYQRFMTADLDGKLTVCREAMDDPALWGDDVAIELLSSIHHDLALADRRPEFEPLVARLKERWPKLHEEMEHRLVLWLAEDARVLGDREKLLGQVRRMAELAEKNLDIANRLVSLLRWHGELALLLEFRTGAWPAVRASSRIMPYGIARFRVEACEEILFSALDRDESIDEKSEAMAKVHAISAGEPLPRNPIWDRAPSGEREHVWTMRELALPAVPQRPDGDAPPVEETPAFGRVRDLLGQFCRYLREKCDVPWTRADMVTGEIGGYLFQRALGELGPRFSRMDRMLKTAEYESARPFPPPKHVLCPDAQTVDVFAAQYFGLLGRHPYHAAALFSGMAPWLQFLRGCGLVNESERAEALAALDEPKRRCGKALENESDPALRNIVNVASR